MVAYLQSDDLRGMESREVVELIFMLVFDHDIHLESIDDRIDPVVETLERSETVGVEVLKGFDEEFVGQGFQSKRSER